MSKKIKAALWISLIVCLCLIGVVFFAGLYSQNKSKNPKPSPGIQVASEEIVVDEHAFLRDEEFLDDYQPFANKERDNDLKSNVSLLVSSVSRDIRITAVDSRGRTLKGKDLSFTVEGLGEYSDPDNDGYVYIGGVRPGKYKISLKENEDYQCDSPVELNVKEQIDYAVLEDISHLIKTEAEIDAMEEDLREREDLSEVTENSEMIIDRSEASFGIDVSKWNGEIDWEKVKEAGVEFAIIRCGYRGSKSGVLVEDPYFEKNLEGAKKAGIEVGVYFFTQAMNENEGIEEASTVLSLLNGRTLDYPIFIDTEGSGGRADSLDVETRTSAITAFLKTIESSDKGYKAGVYASRNWLYKKVRDSEFTPYIIWDAEYCDEPKYTGKFGLWQYTSKGRIDGIEGNVDFDLSYLVKKKAGEQ